jgi:sulfite exporter TauE/SafE
MTMRIAVGLTLGVLVGASLYEALVALGVIELGSQPGEGPRGEQAVALIAVCAMLVAAGLALVAALGARVPFVALLPPAAAAFLVARFYTFDPYYLPALRRFSDDGMLPPGLVYGMVALAIGAGLLTRVNRRLGAALSVPVILACALFAQVVVGGH